MAHHPSQVCLTFGCNGQRSMRLRSDDPPGLYICLWDSALVPHGATLLGPTDRAVAIPFLPWAVIEQKSLDRAAQAMWEHERVLGIVCPLPHKMIEQMQACLAADLAAVGSPVACASLGMLRGGGVAHAKFASTVRTRPEIEAIYRWGWKIAMGVSAPQALVQCWDAVLHSCDDGKFQGHVTHTDEKNDCNLQCEIVLWPLGCGQSKQHKHLRIGLITAFRQLTPTTAKNQLMSFACRHTMMENWAHPN